LGGELLSLKHRIDRYVANITSLFMPYLNQDIKDPVWLRLQTALGKIISQIYQDGQKDKHGKK